jgi:hypothetical protein
MDSKLFQGDGFFKGDKNLQHAFLQRGRKTIGRMSLHVMACEKSLKCEQRCFKD